MPVLDPAALAPAQLDAVSAVVLRWCSKCRQPKALEDYPRDKRARLGRRANCRACERERRRAHYQANAEAERERARARYWANAEAERERARQYRETHREERLAYDRRYREAHRNERRAYNRAYRETHRDDPDYRERERERHRAHYADNRDAYRERHRAHYAANRDAYRERDRRRRARKRGAEVEPVTTADLHAWWDELGLTGCWWCDRPFEPDEPVHIDHLWPLAEEGHHAVRNLVPTHESCNLAKGAALPHEFAARAYAEWLDLHAAPEETP